MSMAPLKIPKKKKIPIYQMHILCESEILYRIFYELSR